MTREIPNPKSQRIGRRFGAVIGVQEVGLVLVVVLLGMVLTAFGGRVRMIEFRKSSSGEMERVVVEKNKFFNARNLTQLAKDTSFIAIMAVGATFVIIAGGIDLSVGATYALASVLGALVFHAFGPSGPHAGAASWQAVPLGILTCVGAATLCGLLNGSMF